MATAKKTTERKSAKASRNLSAAADDEVTRVVGRKGDSRWVPDPGKPTKELSYG
jgi:hypothetical protein